MIACLLFACLLAWLTPFAAGSFEQEFQHTVASPVLTAAIHPSLDMLVWGGEANILFNCVKSSGAITGAERG